MSRRSWSVVLCVLAIILLIAGMLVHDFPLGDVVMSTGLLLVVPAMHLRRRMI
jgi:hypothetical protein